MQGQTSTRSLSQEVSRQLHLTFRLILQTTLVSKCDWYHRYHCNYSAQVPIGVLLA